MEPSVESQVENLCATIIKTDSESWETRNKAVLALNSLVAGIHGKSENAKTEAFTAGCYRALKDAVKNMVSDLRSQQVRDVCTLLCTMAEELGDQAGMRLFLRDAFSAVLDAAKVPNKVMSGFAHDCVLTLLRNCTFKSAISVIVSEIKENKAKSFREKCLEYINEILAHWELVDRDLDAVGEAVRIGLEDAAPGAREAARAAYLTIFHLFPERAANIKAALPGPLQGRLTKAEERDSLGLPPGTGGPNDSFFFPPQEPTEADEQLEQQGQMEPPNTTMAARSVVLGSDISTGNEENSSNINYNSGRSLTTSGASVKAGAASASSGASAATTAELSSSTGSNRSARSGTSQRSANSGSNHLMAPTASSRSRTVPPTADVPKKAPGSRTPTAGSKTPCTGSKTPSAGSKIVVSTAVNSKPPAGHRHQHGPGVGAATTRSARSEQDGYLGDNCDADSVSSAQSSLDGSLGSSGTSGGGGVWKDVAGTAADDVSTDGSEAGPRSSSRSRGRAAGGGASGGASSSGAATQYPPGSIGVGASTVGCQVGAGSKGSKVGKKRQSVVSNPFQTIITSPKNSGAATGDEGAGAAVGTTGALGIAASQTPPSQVQGRGQGQGQREGQGESKRTAQHPHPQHPSGIARPAYARHASLSALPTSTTSTTAPASVRAGKSHASPAQDKSQPDSVGHKETHGLHRCASTPDADALRRRPNPAAPTPIPLTGGSLAGRARIVATPASAAGSQRSAVHTPHTPHTETRLSIKGESSDAEGTPCTPYHAAAATTTTTMGTSSHIRSQSMVDVSRRPGLSDSQQLFPQDLHLNMHVTVTSEGLDIKLLGVVRFLGHTTFASGIWVGVELISDLGKNDGSVAGQRYFTCSPGHGIFVRPTHVEIPAVPQPLPVTLPLGAGSGTGKVSNSNGYNSAGALDRPPLSPRLGAQGTPPQVANSEQQSLKHFQSFQQASAPQPTPAADTCSVTSDAHSADSSRTGQGSVSDLATAVSASGTEGQGEEEGVGEAVGAGAGGSSAISTASGVSIAEAGNGSQGSDRVAVGGSGVRHRKGRATDILKLKLSQMMDLLNQQLEMVVELEEEDKKIETECTGGDRVGVGEATAGGGQSFDVEKVEALQREILAITDQEAELIQSFKRRFVRHMMQRDAD